MTQPAAGWYPDPAGSGDQRWWTGQSWSDTVQPAPPTPQPGPAIPTAPLPDAGLAAAPLPAYGSYPTGAPQQTMGQQPHMAARRAGILGQSGSRSALITLAVVAVYLVIAAETRIVFFGILPLGYALRSKRMREPLWPLAMAAAVLSIIIAAALIFGH